jgi:hypothetical protein
LFQPEHGLSKSAKQSSELDIWPLFQSAWNECSYQVIFTLWHLATISTGAWNELHCKAVLKTLRIWRLFQSEH